MGSVVQISKEAERLRKLSLEQLFRRGEAFGNIGIFSSRDAAPPNCYRCKIEFDSIPGTSVEAKSEFGLPLHDALIQAIDRAERIVETYSK